MGDTGRRMPGGIHPGHGPEGGRAARRGAGHTGMMPSGAHGNNVYRNSFLSPLTLSGFLALLTLLSPSPIRRYE